MKKSLAIILIVFLLFTLFPTSDLTSNATTSLQETLEFVAVADTMVIATGTGYATPDNAIRGSNPSHTFIKTNTEYRIPFIKFKVSSLSGKKIISAKLVLQESPDTNANTTTGFVIKKASSAWIEAGTGACIWSNKPAIYPTVCGTFNASGLVNDAIMETQITDLSIIQEGLITFALDNDNITGNNNGFITKESTTSGVKKPTLVIVCEPDGKTEQCTSEYVTTADAMIRYVNAAPDSTMRGGESTFGIMNTNGDIRKVLMRFNIGDVTNKTILSAKLRMKANINFNKNTNFYIKKADNSWTESTVNWSTAPVIDDSKTYGEFIIGQSVIANDIVDIDITDLSLVQLASGDFTIVLDAPDCPLGTNIKFYSKDDTAGNLKPTLIISYLTEASSINSENGKVLDFMKEKGMVFGSDSFYNNNGNIKIKDVDLLVKRLSKNSIINPATDENEATLEQVVSKVFSVLGTPQKTVLDAKKMGLLAGTNVMAGKTVVINDAIDIFYNALFMRLSNNVLYGVSAGFLPQEVYYNASYDIRMCNSAINADGIHNDFSYIQASLNQSTVMFLPPGEYMISSNLTARGKGLVGTLNSTIVLSTVKEGIRASNIVTGGILFKDLNFIRTSKDNSTNSVLYILNSNDVIVQNISVFNNRSVSPSILIEGQIVDTTETNMTSNNIIVDSCYVENSSRIEVNGIHGSGDGYGIKGSSIVVFFSKNIAVTNNKVVEYQHFMDPSSETINWQGAGITVVSCLYGVVNNNYIYNAPQGIDFGGGVSNNLLTTEVGYRGTKYMLGNNNTILNSYTAALKSVNGASYNMFTNNTIDKFGLVGLWVTPGSNAVLRHSVVKNNLIFNNTIQHGGSGIGTLAWEKTAWKISGISIDPIAGDISQCTGNVIVGNTVSDDINKTCTGITDYGVFSPETFLATKNLIINNSISGSYGKNLVIKDASNTTDPNLLTPNFVKPTNNTIVDAPVVSEISDNASYSINNKFNEKMIVDMGGTDEVTNLSLMPLGIPLFTGANAEIGMNTAEDETEIFQALYSCNNPLSEVIEYYKSNSTLLTGAKYIENENNLVLTGKRANNYFVINIFKNNNASAIKLTVKTPTPEWLEGPHITLGNYKVSSDNILTNIQPQTSVADCLNVLNPKNGATVKFFNSATEIAGSTIIGTGSTISATVNNIATTYTVIVYGDVDGNGSIDLLDLTKMKKHLLKQSSLASIYNTAGKIYHKNNISISDLLAVKKQILGVSQISQSG